MKKKIPHLSNETVFDLARAVIDQPNARVVQCTIDISKVLSSYAATEALAGAGMTLSFLIDHIEAGMKEAGMKLPVQFDELRHLLACCTIGTMGGIEYVTRLKAQRPGPDISRPRKRNTPRSKARGAVYDEE